MTPEAVIDRYLQLVAPGGRDAAALCLLLSADADLSSRWLTALKLPVDLAQLEHRINTLDTAEFDALAQSQSGVLSPSVGSARLSVEQWTSMLRAASLARLLFEHIHADLQGSVLQSDPHLENLRLRMLLALSGVHLAQDPGLTRLNTFRGSAPALMEDAALELRVFAVVDALEVGRGVELAGELLGVSQDIFAALVDEAEVNAQTLIQQLGLELDPGIDWPHRIWLRQQVAILSKSFAICTDIHALNALHNIVSRCVFADVPKLLCQLSDDGPLVLLDNPQIAIRLQSTTSEIAAATRAGSTTRITDTADKAVVDRQLLLELAVEEAWAVPIKCEKRGATLLVGIGAQDDLETLAALYAEGLAPYVADLLLGRHTAAGGSSSPVEAFRAAELQRLREIVHEANNPLSIVHNYLHILELRLRDEPEIVEQLEIVAAELRRAGEVFTRARDVPQQAQHAIVTGDEAREVDVEQWLTRIAEVHRGYAMERNVALQSRIPPSGIHFYTQVEKLTQIATNLVKNAIEACQAGEAVTVGARTGVVRDGCMGLEIYVQDTGPGLDADVLQHLTVAKRSSKGGAHQGVGLSIAFKLAAELQGALDVRTEQGVGTTFSLFLPNR